MATQPQTIGTIPTPPDVVNRQSTFHADAVAMFMALKSVAPQIDAVGQITYANAVSAELSAAVANAQQWASGTYSEGAAAWSPIATAAGTPAVYIRKEPGGASPTDPANDPSNWVKYVPSNTTGGAVYTTSTTLTSGSPFAISISGGAGVWLKLPDAVLMQKGICYAVKNTGENDLSVLDNSGATIGFIRPQCGTTISLADNSTSSGEWDGDWELYGVTIDCVLQPTITVGQNPYAYSVKLTSTKTLIIFGRTRSFYYFFVNDSSTQTNSAITLLMNIASSSMADVIPIGVGDYALAVVAHQDGLRTILINTNTLSTNHLDSTATSSITSFGGLIATSAGAAYSYLSTTTGVIRAITVAGTTINVGSEVTMSAAEPPRLYSVGSSLVAVRHNNAQGITATPYSISGTSLTAGTASTISCDAFVANTIRSDKLTNNDILVCSSYSGAFKSHLFRLSGTVISQFNVVNLTWTSTYRTLDKFSHFDYGGGKLAIALAHTDAYNLYVTLVDYSATTPTSSSIIFYIISGGYVYDSGCGFVANNVYYSFDLSGTSPAIKSIKVLPLSMEMDQNSLTYPKMDSMSFSSNNLRGGGGLKSFVTKGDNARYNVGSLFFTPTSIIEKGSSVNPMVPLVQNFKSSSRKKSISYSAGVIKQVSIID